MMNRELETLLEIQDLKSQRRELADEAGDREVQEQVFGLSVDDALREIVVFLCHYAGWPAGARLSAMVEETIGKARPPAG